MHAIGDVGEIRKARLFQPVNFIDDPILGFRLDLGNITDTQSRQKNWNQKFHDRVVL